MLTIIAVFAKARHQGSTGLNAGRRSLACVDRVDGFPVFGVSSFVVVALDMIEQFMHRWSFTTITNGLRYFGRLV